MSIKLLVKTKLWSTTIIIKWGKYTLQNKIILILPLFIPYKMGKKSKKSKNKIFNNTFYREHRDNVYEKDRKEYDYYYNDSSYHHNNY
jgi:hypothetical protein